MPQCLSHLWLVSPGFTAKLFPDGMTRRGGTRTCTLQHTSYDEQGPLSVCWTHKAMGTCKSHLRLQKTNVSIPVHRSSSEGRGGWSCSDLGAPGRALPEWPRAGGTAQVEAAAQVLLQLCPLPTKIWLCILCPAGGIVGLSFGSSPGDPAGVPGDCGVPEGGIPFSCVFSPSSLSYSPCWVRLAVPPAQLCYAQDTVAEYFVFLENAF